MKKMLGILFAALILSFALSTVASAENTSFFAEYNVLSASNSVPNQDIDYLTIGGEYSDQAIFGASYASGVKFDPDTPGVSSSLYRIFGGYNFVNNDQGNFAVILGYDGFDTKIYGVKIEATMLGLGFKGELKSESMILSLSYLYGVSNSIKRDGSKFDSPDVSDLQLNIGYMFNDAWGLYLNYSQYSIKSDWTDIGGILNRADGDLSGCSLGVLYKF